MREFQRGMRVCMSRDWCRSTGQFTGRAPFLRGDIIKTEPFGDVQLCHILWDDGAIGRVIAPNLTLVARIHLEPQ